jgi:hypothetical protein
MPYDELLSTDDLSATVPQKINQNFLRRAELNGATMTASFTAWADDTTGVPKDIYYCDTSGGSITVALPDATATDAARGRVVTFIKTNAANSLILDPNAAQTINGAATLTITAIYDFRGIVSDGTEWFVAASN